MSLIISGTTATGVTLVSGNTPVTITASAYLNNNTSGTYAVFYGHTTSSQTIFNAGQIAGKYDGVNVEDLAALTNKTTGTIIGGFYGVFSSAKAGTVTNAGIIAGNGQIAVYLNATGIVLGHASVVNQSTGTIVGGDIGIDLTQSSTGFSTVTNAGVITGASQYGVYLKQGGRVTNQGGGRIGGGTDAVFAKSGVTVVNQGSATISGGANGVDVNTGLGTVTNAGAISGYGTSAVYLQAGGSVVNASSGTMAGAIDGINIRPTVIGGGTVTNAGAVTGTGAYGVYLPFGGVVTNQGGGTIAGGIVGVVSKDGGTVVNQSSATINGGTIGVDIGTLSATVTNAGAISGRVAYGVYIGVGGSLSNSSTGTIAGGKDGVIDLTGTATVTNAGAISGSSAYGVRLAGGGTLTNTSTGTISGGGVAAIGMGGTSETVVNAGTIIGIEAVSFANGSTNTNRLILDPGGVISGSLNGGASAVSTLEFAAGTVHGQISGFGQTGTNFVTNFASIVVDPAAQWLLQGPNTLATGSVLTNSGELTIANGYLSDAGSIVNNGTILDEGSLTIAGSLTGTGQVLIGANSALTTSVYVPGSQTIAFTGGGGLLDITPASFSGIIQGFESGDAIELAGVFNATSASIVNGTTLSVALASGGPINLLLAPDQVYSNLIFAIEAPGLLVGGSDFIAVTGPTGPTIVDYGASMALTGAQATTLAAAAASGLGGITVTDPNSLLTTTGNVFTVGDVSLGSLSVQSGGTVITNPGSGVTGAVIAGQSGATGSVASVTGAGSNWQITGTLDVGAAAYGSLAVTAGGAVTASAFDAGVMAGASGIVSVVGTGSAVTVAGNLVLGDGGIGELSVLTGATLSATGSATIGNLAGSSGNVDLEGAGSKLSIGGALDLGVSGLAVLTVGAGATLHVAGALVQGASGNLNVAGGVVDPTNSTLSGSTKLSAGASYQDFGTLTLKGGVTVDAGAGYLAAEAIKGKGSLVVGNTGTLVLTDAYGNDIGPVFVASSHPSVVFASNTVDAHPTLAVTDLGGFDTVINGFTVGDVIDLPDLAAITGETLVAGTPTIDLYGASGLLGALVFDNATDAGYALGTAGQFAAGTSGTIDQAAVTIPTLACYRAGTKLLTMRGEIAVEFLSPGDLLPTVTDGRLAPVVWVGHTAVDPARHPHPDAVQPVRVSAGAFADGVPHRDLFLSPDHAVLWQGRLVPVHLLVNGATIRREALHGTLTYWHVELDRHAAVLAEGLPAESYLDTSNRDQFAGETGAQPLHPDLAADHSLAIWAAAGCAPLLLEGDDLAAMHGALARRAERLGFARTDDAGLSLTADGAKLAATEVRPGVWRAVVPAGARWLAIGSRSTVPEEHDRRSDDRRRLGVALASLTLDGAALADAAYVTGFHPPERDGAARWRWTDGAARVRLPASPQPAVLELRLHTGWRCYWAA